MVKSIMRVALTCTPVIRPISPPVKANLLREILFADDRLFAASRAPPYSSDAHDQKLGINHIHVYIRWAPLAITAKSSEHTNPITQVILYIEFLSPSLPFPSYQSIDWIFTQNNNINNAFFQPHRHCSPRRSRRQHFCCSRS